MHLLESNSKKATPIFGDSDHSRLTFRAKLAKVNISMVKIFVEWNVWSFQRTNTRSKDNSNKKN